MPIVTKRELNQHTAQVLALAGEGEPVVVTERGRARWQIEQIASGGDPVAQLRSSGRITAPSVAPAPWPRDRVRPDPARVDALYAESRGER